MSGLQSANLEFDDQFFGNEKNIEKEKVCW